MIKDDDVDDVVTKSQQTINNDAWSSLFRVEKSIEQPRYSSMMMVKSTMHLMERETFFFFGRFRLNKCSVRNGKANDDRAAAR